MNSSSIGPELSYDVGACGVPSRRLEQTRAAQDIIAADQRNLKFVQILQAVGKSAGLDVLAAESQLASDRALLPPLLQQASPARHALAVLVGQESANRSAPDFEFGTLVLPSKPPLSLPSAPVHYLPDSQAAEAQFRAVNAAISIATTQLYPSITLSTSWTAAFDGGALFANPSHVWDIADELVPPVFNDGTLHAQRNGAVNAYATQLGTYRKNVQLAFAQVADVLQALANDTALLEAHTRPWMRRRRDWNSRSKVLR